MGTKNDPGEFDCYANAAPDEPMFVLLGRDPVASILVRRWAELRYELGLMESTAKMAEARRCADAMEAWCCKLGRAQDVRLARGAAARRREVLKELVEALQAVDQFLPGDARLESALDDAAEELELEGWFPEESEG